MSKKSDIYDDQVWLIPSNIFIDDNLTSIEIKTLLKNIFTIL